MGQISTFWAESGSGGGSDGGEQGKVAQNDDWNMEW